MTVPVLNLRPARFDWEGARAGDVNGPIRFTLVQGGAPVDLTGLTPRAQVRVKATDATALLEAAIEVTDAAAGVLTIRWPGDQVRALLAGKATFKGVWDLQVAANGSDAQTLLAGKFEADMDVTRDDA